MAFFSPCLFFSAQLAFVVIVQHFSACRFLSIFIKVKALSTALLALVPPPPPLHLPHFILCCFSPFYINWYSLLLLHPQLSFLSNDSLMYNDYHLLSFFLHFLPSLLSHTFLLFLCPPYTFLTSNNPSPSLYSTLYPSYTMSVAL